MGTHTDPVGDLQIYSAEWEERRERKRLDGECPVFPDCWVEPAQSHLCRDTVHRWPIDR